MSGTDDLGTLSIGEYLLSLADGIVHAQQQLSLSRIASADGEQAVAYQIPRIEFELKMSIELARTESQSGGDTQPIPTGPGGIYAPVLKVRPAEIGPGAGRNALSGTVSTIRGSFVAVPVQGGRPPPMVSLTLQQVSPLQLTIIVTVRTTANEPVIGATAEFNIDRALTQQLSLKAQVSGVLSDGTFLDRAVSVTDQNGRAASTLTVSIDEPLGTAIAIVIDVAGQTEQVIYRREATGARTRS